MWIDPYAICERAVFSTATLYDPCAHMSDLLPVPFHHGPDGVIVMGKWMFLTLQVILSPYFLINLKMLTK